MTDPFGFDALDVAWLRAKSGAKWHKHADQLAAWVADMDFPPAPVIAQAIHRRADAGDLGYADWGYPHPRSPACQLFADRAANRYAWQFDVDEVREFCDVVQGVQVALHLATAPGDAVVLHTPSYPPLWKALAHMGRRQIDVPAHVDASGVSFDYDALDRQLARDPARVLLLCHPHNPTGHRFDHAELARLADLADRHDLLIISDEIHADLTYAPATHVPIASVSRETAARTVTLHSASKAFNVAGMRHALGHVGPPAIRRQMAQMPDHLMGAINLLAAEVTVAAWRDGDQWLTAALAQLDANRRLLGSLLAEHMPDIGYRAPDATYLAWLDCHRFGAGDEPFEMFRRRGVQLSPGTEFGAAGAGHVRLNFATSSSILRTIVATMAGANGGVAPS